MFICFILFNFLLAYFIGKMMKLNKLLLATFMIMATFGNTSFIGFSYIDAFYGQDYIVYGLIYDLFGSFLLLVSIGMFIITWGSGKKIIQNLFLKVFFYFRLL
jgi:predicted permease